MKKRRSSTNICHFHHVPIYEKSYYVSRNSRLISFCPKRKKIVYQTYSCMLEDYLPTFFRITSFLFVIIMAQRDINYMYIFSFKKCINFNLKNGIREKCECMTYFFPQTLSHHITYKVCKLGVPSTTQI